MMMLLSLILKVVADMAAAAEATVAATAADVATEVDMGAAAEATAADMEAAAEVTAADAAATVVDAAVTVVAVATTVSDPLFPPALKPFPILSRARPQPQLPLNPFPPTFPPTIAPQLFPNFSFASENTQGSGYGIDSGYGGYRNSIYGSYGSSGGGGGYYDDMDDDCCSYGGGYSSYGGGCGGSVYAASSAQPTTASQSALVGISSSRSSSEMPNLDSLISGSDGSANSIGGASDSSADNFPQQDPWMLPNNFNDGPLNPFDLATGGDSNGQPTLASSSGSRQAPTSSASTSTSASSSSSSSSSTDRQRERSRLKPDNRQQLQAPLQASFLTTLFGGPSQQVPVPSVPSSTTTAAPEYVMINPARTANNQDE